MVQGPGAECDLDVGVAAVADVAGDVEVVAGEVGLGVEEVEEVAPSQGRRGGRGDFTREGGQRLGADVGERGEAGAGVLELVGGVGGGELVGEVEPADLGSPGGSGAV